MATIKTFKPNRELLEFATFFSTHFRTLLPGVYASDGDKFKVMYAKNSKWGIARIGIEKGVIWFNRRPLMAKKYNSDFVFFIFMWLLVVRRAAKYQKQKTKKRKTTKKVVTRKPEAQNRQLELFKPRPSDLSCKTTPDSIIDVLKFILTAVSEKIKRDSKK